MPLCKRIASRGLVIVGEGAGDGDDDGDGEGDGGGEDPTATLFVEEQLKLTPKSKKRNARRVVKKLIAACCRASALFGFGACRRALFRPTPHP